ncbi:MAG: phosphatase PAP2 family protein [Deltaproteobacteria bacterium]|nr:phosphatase PAP2 family protein [Deltaproteobacteria bacterium]
MSRARFIRNSVIAFSILGIGMIPYTWIGHHTDVHTATTLRTRWDDLIPFLPWTIYLYSWVYTQMFYPLFVVRGEKLFWRTVWAFVFVVSVDLVTYAVFPVTAWGFRPDHTAIDPSSFTGWGVKLTLFLDPPTNLFPSQHLSTAILACLAAWKARPAWGLLILPLALAIAFSILTMKQHYIADGVAAGVLTFAAWWLFLRTYRREDEEHPASTWRGPMAYFAFHGLFYLSMYLAYLGGWTPWAGTGSV